MKPTGRTWTTQKLAEYIHGVSLENISAQTRAMAKNCLLDLAGAAIAGSEMASTLAIRHLTLNRFAPGKAGVWFSRTKRSPAAAALANSAAAAALDLDDGHRRAGGHPGASVIPAVAAVAQEIGANGDSVIAAMVIGYEIAIRIAAARDFTRLDTLSSGRWCAYGAAASAAWLLRSSERVTAQALAIAGVQSPGLSAAGYSRIMGNHVKEGIPWATMTGLTAVDLAAGGFTGPTDILDHPDYYDASRILADLGSGFAIDGIYFKPYACCRWIHSALDALGDIMTEHRLEVGHVTAVAVHTFDRALRLNNYPDPDSLEAAQYSLPFCLGVVATQGRAALLPLKAVSLHRREAVDFARRVSLAVGPELDRLFPEKTAARIVVQARGKTYEKLVTDPLGDPVNPMGFDQLTAKFKQLTQDRLTAACQNQMVAAVERFEETGPREVLDILESC